MSRDLSAKNALQLVLPMLTVGFVLASAMPAVAYTPDDPRVEALVAEGMKYIESQSTYQSKYGLANGFRGGYGEIALLGYTHMKVNHDKDHPVVTRGIKAAQDLLSKLNEKDPGGHESKTVYTISVAAMLLAEVDKKRYKSELQRIASHLQRIQYANGGYGYILDKVGDVSQTQYAMLAIWTLDHAGIKIDYKGVPRTISWLMRVQDPGGGWPYQGQDPGAAGRRIKQSQVTASMGVAGGSAALIGADVLRLWGDSLSKDNPGIDGLPKAVKVFVDDGSGNVDVKRPNYDSDTVLKSISDCDTWLRSNSPDPGRLRSAWPYYQLYTLERYHSFREIAMEMDKTPSPDWYNSGVEYLIEQKDADGGWSKDGGVTKAVNTAFAVLFLIRSTQKAIATVSSGATAGGWGLPGDTTDITVDGTQIKAKPVAAAVDDLLHLLEGDGADGIEGKSIPEDLELAKEPKARAAQIDRMERLVRGSKSWQARRVAARLIAQSDELRVVPTLIFALSDPDPMVPRYARDGLRFLSRKFDGYELPDKPSPNEVSQAQRKWRQWYLTVDPEFIFLDY